MPVLKYWTGAAWAIVDVADGGGGGGGDVASDAIFDAKGDLPAGTGADTAAKRTVGANDTVLTADSAESTGMKWVAPSGVTTGTSFPGSPSTGDRYRRSDLDYQIYFYDGTRWLSEQIFAVTMDNQGSWPVTGTTSPLRYAPYAATNIWLMDWHGLVYIGVTNDGSHYWTLDFLEKHDAATNVLDSYATSGDSPDTNIRYKRTIDAVVNFASTYAWVQIRFTETGTAGDVIYASSFIRFREIAT